MIGEDGRNSNKIMYVNYLYRLREVKAPVGYRINKEHSYIYKYKEDFGEEYYPDGLDLSVVKPLNNGSIYVLDEYIGDNPETSDFIKLFIVILISIMTLLLIIIPIVKVRNNVSLK